MLLASAVPCLLITPLRITMPESPLWLSNHGRLEHAARIVYAKFGGDIRLPASVPVTVTRKGRWT
jgi:putative MFS transporter